MSQTSPHHTGCAKGFIDKPDEFMRERQRIIDIVDGVFKQHCAEKIETPVLELKDLFTRDGKPLENLIDLDDQGDLLAMRYDLKHPLARYLLMNEDQNHTNISQFGCVYRKENFDLQKFRLREFFVADFDICSAADVMISETQCLRICFDIIKSLKLEKPVKVVIGHRKITEAILKFSESISDENAVEYVNKFSDYSSRSYIDWNKIKASTGGIEIRKSVATSHFKNNLESFSGDFEYTLSKIRESHYLKHLKDVIASLEKLKQYCQCLLSESDYKEIHFDFNLIGSSYFYTGLVFVAQLENKDINLLSGGRYELLSFKNGCTGLSVGIDQLTMRILHSQGSMADIYKKYGQSETIIDKKQQCDKESTKKVQSVDSKVWKTAKGSMDRNPRQMIVREHVFNTIINCFKRHNAKTIDTPVIERKEVLIGKYGEDNKLIYDLNEIDGEELSLRYDLTVPLARFLAIHKDVFTNEKWFTRYQIGKVFRRDNPSLSSGRYREFYQCDIDIVGPSKKRMQYEIECLNIVSDILKDLDFGNYKIKVNHRKFLRGLMEVCGVPETLFQTVNASIDKLDKKSLKEVRDEMVENGLTVDVAKRIGKYLIKFGGIELVEELERDETLRTNQNVKSGLEDLRILFTECATINDIVVFTLSLVRGPDYYTGIVLEAVFSEAEAESSKITTSLNSKIGSVSGGGRYDNLVNMFTWSDTTIPCFGLSMGIERLMAVYENTKLKEIEQTKKRQIMVISAHTNMIVERLKLLSIFLNEGISATQSMKINPELLDVFQECERMEIPFVVIIEKDELAKDFVTLRNVQTKREELIRRSDIVARIRKELQM